MSLSYHSLRLADVSIHAIVVHQALALPVRLVLLRYDSKHVGHLVAAEPVPGLRILNQLINAILRVLLLGQIDHVDLGRLHLPLQHLCVKKNYICMSK
jgi:hypothetical protein